MNAEIVTTVQTLIASVRAETLAGLRRCDLSGELVEAIAVDAIDAYRHYVEHDGYPPDAAVAAAVRDVVAGAADDVQALDAGSATDATGEEPRAQ